MKKKKLNFKKVMDLAYEINNKFHYGMVTSLEEAIKYYNLKLD